MRFLYTPEMDDFIRDHREGIDLTVDTCGYAPYERLEAILPYVSTFLYDIKCMDSARHRRWTGTGNERILDNLVRLSRAGAGIRIRIPVIREVNGDRDSMLAVIRFLRDNGIRPERIHLLPYHDTGSGKYPKIGRQYDGSGLSAPDIPELEEFAALFRSAGYENTVIGG